MKEQIKVGLLYSAKRHGHENLETLAERLKKDKNFEIEHSDNFYIRLSSPDKKDIILYHDSDILYTGLMKSERFSSEQLLALAKEGWKLIQKYHPHRDYEDKLGLILRNDNPQKTYCKNKKAIKELAKKLFSRYTISMLENSKKRVQISIRQTHKLRI